MTTGKREEKQSSIPQGFTLGLRPGPGGRGGMRIGQPVQKAQDVSGTLRKLGDCIKPHIFVFLAIIAMTVGASVFSVLAPKVMGRAITALFDGITAKIAQVPGATIDFRLIGNVLLTLAVLYSLNIVFSYLQQFLMIGITQKIVRKLRSDVMEKLTRLPLKYFDTKTHGEILSRVTNDVDNLSSTLQQSLTQLIASVVTMVGVVIMMFSINVVLALLTMVTFPLSLFSISCITKKSQKYFKQQQRSLGQLSGHVEEMYSGHIAVKSYNQEKTSVKRFAGLNEELYHAGWKANFISGITMPLMNVIGNIGYILVAVVGGIFVARRAVSIGDIQAFFQYSRQFNQPITQIANIMNLIQSTIASAERVFEILDEREEIDRGDEKPLSKPVDGKVTFEDISFSYVKDKPLIEDLTIHVQKGQTIAIVGPTGAGKTTLVNLLMRFYEVERGRISIDDRDILSVQRDDLREVFGMVLQESWLFNGTIRENIAYGKETATENEIVAASIAANAHHFIMALPEGYETVINEEASNISQGEKQLLTIARAFLTDPEILILDEATSNVDTLTEISIQKAMKELMNGRTSFVIAHRLSTIKNADVILAMNEGKIIEMGTHVELLQNKGFYAELYWSQFTGKNGMPTTVVNAGKE
jgi:ATP-binding cassette subfamily B protein